MLVCCISDPDYEPGYALQMLPLIHFKLDFRIHNACHFFVSLDRNEAWQVINLSIFCRKSNISPKYMSGKNQAEKEADYFLINPVPILVWPGMTPSVASIQIRLLNDVTQQCFLNLFLGFLGYHMLQKYHTSKDSGKF